MLVFSAAAVFFVSEDTYYKTIATARGTVASSDSHARSARLLQLLADVKTAEYGYLLTGQPG